MRSKQYTPQLALSTAVGKRVPKTESEGSAVEEQLSNKTIHHAMRAELHLPLLDGDDDDDDDDDEVLLYVHRNRRFIRYGSPGRPPRLSHSS